jgi:hypothetical protein
MEVQLHLPDMSHTMFHVSEKACQKTAEIKASHNVCLASCINEAPWFGEI